MKRDYKKLPSLYRNVSYRSFCQYVIPVSVVLEKTMLLRCIFKCGVGSAVDSRSASKDPRLLTLFKAVLGSSTRACI